MNRKRWWIHLAENQRSRQIFRAVSAVNLLVLVFSIPFYNLSTIYDTEERENLKRRQIVLFQFYVITGLDFILACIYMFQLIIRVSYYCHIKRVKQVCPLMQCTWKNSPCVVYGCSPCVVYVCVVYGCVNTCGYVTTSIHVSSPLM